MSNVHCALTIKYATVVPDPARRSGTCNQNHHVPSVIKNLHRLSRSPINERPRINFNIELALLNCGIEKVLHCFFPGTWMIMG